MRDPGITRQKPTEQKKSEVEFRDVWKACAKQMSPQERGCALLGISQKNIFPFLGPSAMPIAFPTRGVLRGAIGRRPADSAVRGRRTKFTTCAIVPLACIRFGGSGAGSTRRGSRVVGRPKLRDVRITGVRGRLVSGLFGSFITAMSASRLRDTRGVLR